MRVRLTALLLFCCLALSPLAAADGRLPVYYRGEVEMFADDVDKCYRHPEMSEKRRANLTKCRVVLS